MKTACTTIGGNVRTKTRRVAGIKFSLVHSNDPGEEVYESWVSKYNFDNEYPKRVSSDKAADFYIYLAKTTFNGGLEEWAASFALFETQQEHSTPQGALAELEHLLETEHKRIGIALEILDRQTCSTLKKYRKRDS